MSNLQSNATNKYFQNSSSNNNEESDVKSIENKNMKVQTNIEAVNSQSMKLNQFNRIIQLEEEDKEFEEENSKESLSIDNYLPPIFFNEGKSVKNKLTSKTVKDDTKTTLNNFNQSPSKPAKKSIQSTSTGLYAKSNFTSESTMVYPIQTQNIQFNPNMQGYHKNQSMNNNFSNYNFYSNPENYSQQYKNKVYNNSIGNPNNLNNITPHEMTRNLNNSCSYNHQDNYVNSNFVYNNCNDPNNLKFTNHNFNFQTYNQEFTNQYIPNNTGNITYYGNNINQNKIYAPTSLMNFTSVNNPQNYSFSQNQNYNINMQNFSPNQNINSHYPYQSNSFQAEFNNNLGLNPSNYIQKKCYNEIQNSGYNQIFLNNPQTPLGINSNNINLQTQLIQQQQQNYSSPYNIQGKRICIEDEFENFKIKDHYKNKKYSSEISSKLLNEYQEKIKKAKGKSDEIKLKKMSKCSSVKNDNNEDEDFTQDSKQFSSEFFDSSHEDEVKPSILGNLKKNINCKNQIDNLDKKTKKKRNSNANKSKKSQEIDIQFLEDTNNMEKLIKDQIYCRKIQDLVKSNPEIVEKIIVPKIKHSFYKLCCNRFANYLIQIMIEFMSKKSLDLLYKSVSALVLFFKDSA